MVWFYNQRGGAENLIKEANNDAGLAAHPSGRFDVNGNHFQLAMLAYNLNCWLMLFNREPQADATATAPHDSGDFAVALPVRGGQDLASRGPHRRQLQRSLRGEGRVRAADESAAADRAARRGLCAGDAAGPALKNSPPALRAPCIEIYARLASAMKQVTSARGLAGTDSREGDEAAKIELTYSTTSGISRADQRSER